MKMDKIYTRTGDDGRTSLITGERVSKAAMRVEAFGMADELNSIIGIIRTWAGQGADAAIRAESEGVLKQIQNDLFDIGAILACNPARADALLPPFPASRAGDLERQIDRYQEHLGMLTSFVLPGGSMLNAHAHLARTVCRRTERVLWALAASESVPEAILVYVNRLSDYLFVFSRWVLHVEGCPEFLWVPGGKQTGS